MENSSIVKPIQRTIQKVPDPLIQAILLLMRSCWDLLSSVGRGSIKSSELLSQLRVDNDVGHEHMFL